MAGTKKEPPGRSPCGSFPQLPARRRFRRIGRRGRRFPKEKATTPNRAVAGSLRRRPIRTTARTIEFRMRVATEVVR
jgi:hypothetical protein